MKRLLHLQKRVANHRAVHDPVVKGQSHRHLAAGRHGTIVQKCAPQSRHFQGPGAERTHSGDAEGPEVAGAGGRQDIEAEPQQETTEQRGQPANQHRLAERAEALDRLLLVAAQMLVEGLQRLFFRADQRSQEDHVLITDTAIDDDTGDLVLVLADMSPRERKVRRAHGRMVAGGQSEGLGHDGPPTRPRRGRAPRRRHVSQLHVALGRGRVTSSAEVQVIAQHAPTQRKRSFTASGLDHSASPIHRAWTEAPVSGHCAPTVLSTGGSVIFKRSAAVPLARSESHRATAQRKWFGLCSYLAALYLIRVAERGSKFRARILVVRPGAWRQLTTLNKRFLGVEEGVPRLLDRGSLRLLTRLASGVESVLLLLVILKGGFPTVLPISEVM